MTYRILHTADIHLDRSFPAVDNDLGVANERRAALRRCVSRLGDLARENRCDVITIGGDLYEDRHSDPSTAAFLAEAFAQCAPLRVVISPGNHDNYHPQSLYATWAWPDNVHIFTDTVLSPLDLGNGLHLWGMAHPNPAFAGDPFAGTQLPKDGRHIALFHGAETGNIPQGKKIHGPFAEGQIHAVGFELALLGHYHKQRINTTTGLIYPGSPEPLALDETGARGPIVITLDQKSWQATPLDTAVWSAVDVTETTSGVASMEKLVAVAGDRIQQHLIRTPAMTLATVRLRGEAAPTLHLSASGLRTALRDTTGIRSITVEDGTTPALSDHDINNDPTVRGEFVRTMRRLIDDQSDPTERTVLEMALSDGLSALAGVPPAAL